MNHLSDEHNPKLNGQQARSLATQHALMEAAESLAASKGIQNVTIKDIVSEAGQKNESALQYHFRNLQGLINAIHLRRNQQTQEKRSELLAELSASATKASLRDLCRVMVLPTFLLARSDKKYRRYIVAFSHEIALATDSAFERVSKSGGGGQSGRQTGELLRTALSHLDEPLYRARMDLAIRMISASMGHRARQSSAFRGKAAELFISNLIDALEGLLKAPPSKETRTQLTSDTS